MSHDTVQETGSESDAAAERIQVYLDDGEAPIAEYEPPARVTVDTNQLADGEHVLRIEAESADGMRGVRRVPFEVRNGPAIDIDGLGDGEVVRGDLSLMIHAWGGAAQEDWEPSRVESPAPPPTWAWVLVILIIAWALYYGVMYWSPFGAYADSPTYAPAEKAATSTTEPGERP